MSYGKPVKNFFRNHYGFILGFIGGIGFILFCVEAYKSLKNPFLYMGSGGLLFVSVAVYRKIEKEAASLSSAKENSEAKPK
jgi:hypothetical protein